jgi:thiamine-monophosphate kinase
MKVAELGEFGLIDLLAKIIAETQNNRLAPHKELIIGIGDDTAAWHGDKSIQLATVDCLIQNVHFSLDTTTWRELGWKVLAINLSDIAAMGGLPRYALVALALPGATEVGDVAELYTGLMELANPSGVAIIGGNTSQAPEVAITVTVLGRSQGKKLLRRSTARPGDSLAVTGYLGSAGAGREMLMKKLQFKPEAAAYLREAFLKPRPRLAEGQQLVKHGVATAIDISDGLLADLRHICQASHVGARVEVERLPIHPAVKENFQDRATALALGGGEDYELTFTAGSTTINKIRKEASCPITVIGEITDGPAGAIDLRDKSGKVVSAPEAGWEHFKKG